MLGVGFGGSVPTFGGWRPKVGEYPSDVVLGGDSETEKDGAVEHPGDQEPPAYVGFVDVKKTDRPHCAKEGRYVKSSYYKSYILAILIPKTTSWHWHIYIHSPLETTTSIDR